MDTVLVGRPYKTFEFIEGELFDYNKIKYWQGVVVETNEMLPLGGSLIKTCENYFSNRSTYWGPRQTAPSSRFQSMAAHPNLGCGYAGTFNIVCGQTAQEIAAGTCSAKVDISTCKPPPYGIALSKCMSLTTTTRGFSGPTQPTVKDWLSVEEINFTLADLPAPHEITTQTTTPFPCCEVHVGSVCRPDINFDYPAKTTMGRWDAKPAYDRKVGYFPIVPCDKQAKSVPRACPRVKLKVTNTGYLQWPHCLKACSQPIAQKEFNKICNRTSNPELEKAELKAHKMKIDSMKAKVKTLEEWTQKRMASVIESKRVVDCFDDKLPRRYNALALPKMRSGFDTMPLHNQCRLHGCKVTQCLEVKTKCKVPFVHQSPEIMCNVYRPNGSFSCVDKVGISTNNPVSLGFGIAWMVIGSLFLCAGVATWVREMSFDGNPFTAKT